MEQQKIKEKIKFAEESVIEIQDPQLKLKAFELVLTKLLTDNLSEEARSVKQRKNRPIQAKKQNSPSGLKKEVKITQLKFLEQELTELRTFYDNFKPMGRESNIFILSVFLKEIIKLDSFHEGDVEYCYQQLINLRTINKPPAMNIDNIKQALSWLVAPSRQKQWLEIDGGGNYKISAGGTLHFRDLEGQIKHEGNKNTTK